MNENQENDLVYNKTTLEELVNKDSDKDGVLDWEEALWGLNPKQKETTPGIPDSVAVSKMKTEQLNSSGTSDVSNTNNESLTQTDKFSRELFATMATLSQDKTIDQATADKISNSLAEQIQNTAPEKVFLLSDFKIIKSDLYKDIKKYSDTFDNLFPKDPVKYTVLDVLQQLTQDSNNIDTSVLSKLEPIIIQSQKIIDGMTKMEVPQSLASLHLDFINTLQRVVENLNNIKLFDNDPIVALSGISQYEKNSSLLGSSVENLYNAIKQKLNK